MASVVYNQGDPQFTVVLTPQEQVTVNRLLAKGYTAGIAAMLTDWIRLRYAEIAAADMAQITARLDTATESDRALVKFALNISDVSVSATPVTAAPMTA